MADRGSADQLSAIIAAGDRLRDDLSVLLDTDDVEGKADALGLDVGAHLDEWDRTTEGASADG